MRLIDADAMFDENHWHTTFDKNLDYCDDSDIAEWIDEQPTIDAQPVRHGKWRHLGGDEWCCTVCGEVIYTEGSWEKPTHKYCHECGAKMDGERK